MIQDNSTNANNIKGGLSVQEIPSLEQTTVKVNDKYWNENYLSNSIFFEGVKKYGDWKEYQHKSE
jgi:hypothetical protein